LKQIIKKIAIGFNAVLLLLVFFVYQSHSLQKFDHLLFDYGMLKASGEPPDPRIVVVGIDDASLAQLGQFPWDRAVYAPLLDQLNQPGAIPKAIAFDIVFAEASDQTDSDLAFASALAESPNVILPVVGNMGGEVFGTSVAKPDAYIQAQSLTRPYELFAASAKQAHINRIVSEDKIIRQTWLKIQDENGEVIPSLAYQAAQMAGADLSRYDALTDPQKTNDPVAKNTITIDSRNTEEFTTVSFLDVLNGEIPADVFKDAVVLIGFTAVGLSGDGGQDTAATPIEKNVKLVYTHANIVNQLLKGDVIRYAPNWAEMLLAAILFALFVGLPWKLKNVYSILAFLVVFAGLLLLQYVLFDVSKFHLDVVYGLFAMLLAYLANVSLKSYMDATQKNFVTRQFGRYISPDLVKQIVTQDIDIKLGGDLKTITILFLDIRGFTPLSEKLTPPELVDTLNTMFNMITETTLRNNGTIDKFIGDAAMILFNAPLDLEDHERLAVKTAYEIQQGMNPIRDKILEKYDCEVHVGIGIHTGPVVIGNIGSYLRVDYTAIGDNVNIAARIESQTKKGQIHVSEQVYDKTKAHFRYDGGEDRMFKGKSQPIRVFEVLGSID
jgi:adenylate cyclase